jgi:hypothetical protein
MNEALRQQVRRQSHYRCEYCKIREGDLLFSPFHLDHIVARQHGGKDELQNLAWSCHECNLRKGPNLSSADPDTGEIVRLFNPRNEEWVKHFWREGDYIRGVTPVGRATVWLLQFNSADRIELRSVLRQLGEP